MAKLVVVAASGCHCMLPGAPPIPGNVCNYVGRVYNSKTGAYDIDRAPAEFHDDGSIASRYVKKLVSRGELLPYDADTALACGVNYQQISFDTIRGEWVVSEKKGK